MKPTQNPRLVRTIFYDSTADRSRLAPYERDPRYVIRECWPSHATIFAISSNPQGARP